MVSVQQSSVSQGELLQVAEAQLAGCPKEWVSDPLKWDAGI